MIDGELVILDDDGAEVFDALQNRLHPAESRVKMLAEETPALFRAFDLLAVGDETALESPFTERRAALEKLARRVQAIPGSVELTPLVDDRRGRRALARERRGRDREGARRALPARASARRWSR